MKKYFVSFGICFVLGFMPFMTYAAGEAGFGFGGLTPSTLTGTFATDFYWNAYLGYQSDTSPWEVRGNLGHYSNISHNPADAGTNLTLSMVPLTGALIYHFGSAESFIQPYLGAGVGAYFFGLRDDSFGDYGGSTKFGFHALGGVKINLMQDVYLNAEYTRHFMGALPYFSAANFNNSAFTFGIGFMFPTSGTYRRTQTTTSQTSRYSSHETEVLAQIDELKKEIQEMKDKRTQLEKDVDTFYEKTNMDEQGILACVDKKINLVGGSLRMVSPGTQQELLSGVITSFEEKDRKLHVVLKHDQWSTELIITREPFGVNIGDTFYPGFTASNTDQSILISNVSNSDDFAKEYRKTKYIEDKMKNLDRKISEAQTQLTTLETQWEREHQADVVPVEQHVIYYHENYVVHPIYRSYYGGRSYYQPNYYYHPQDYVVPVYIQSTPVTVEERQQFIEKKKERVQELKNRR